jgi:hypothetical protein
MHGTAKVGANYRVAINQVERVVSSPRNPQVRTRAGLSPWPASSSKQTYAPKSRAAFLAFQRGWLTCDDSGRAGSGR